MLAVPMGAGLYLCREWTALGRAFAVATAYMPSASSERRDPYIHSVQWSRRFIGAKVFVALATLGLPGYRGMFERQIGLGERLRARLVEDGWRVLNATSLPVVCFACEDASDNVVQDIVADVVASGEAWLSTVRIKGRSALRACVTSYETMEEDVDRLVELLKRSRDSRAPTRSM